MRARKAFSLLEVLIVIALIGILANLAVSNYLKHILKVRRHEALANLLVIQLHEEEYYLVHHTYANEFSALKLTLDNENYHYFIPLATKRFYLLQAEAQGQQKKDKENKIDCWQLLLDQSGLKRPVACWN